MRGRVQEVVFKQREGKKGREPVSCRTRSDVASTETLSETEDRTDTLMETQTSDTYLCSFAGNITTRKLSVISWNSNDICLLK